MTEPVKKINLDEYMLTQGQVFLLEGWHEEHTSFEVFVRSLPGQNAADPRTARTYLVAGGLSKALEYLENVQATERHLQWLAEDGYHPDFIELMRTWRFRGVIDAVPEGTIITNQVPLATISGTRFDCEMVESALLGIFGPHTLFATKAARIVQAADGRPLWDFSLRRLQDPAVAATVARQSYITGFAGTASWEYGHELGIPTTGTMAHHFVMRFGPEGEQEAFEAFLRHWPGRGTLLPDTYSTLRGTHLAMQASKAVDVPLKATRLDSGDLLQLSIDSRKMLDDNGFVASQIIATNDLEEIAIADLISAGACIDSFGVGTMLGTSADAPALGIVYKLSEQTIEGQTTQRMKLAPGKQTDPGSHRVWRRDDRQLVLALAGEDLSSEAQVLTQRQMTAGKALPQPDLEQIRRYTMGEIAGMPDYACFGHDAKPLTLERTQKLWRLRADLGDAQAEQMIIT